MIFMAKYVSMFCIDGEPILPPLMTIEKRFEMQMYREKAVQLERKFVAEKQKRKVQFCEMEIPESPRGQLDLDDLNGNEITSARTSECDEEGKPSSSENSTSFILTPSKPYKIVDCSPETSKTLIDSSTNTIGKMNGEDNIKERMRKLSKSKTLCFDNTTNSIIRSMTDEEIVCASGQSGREIYLCELVENAHLNSAAQTKKTLHLPLQTIQTIPSIFVNPPTPLTGPSICETLSATESVDSYDASGFQSSQATQNHAAELTDDSTDQSTARTISTPHAPHSSTVARALNFGQDLQIELYSSSPQVPLRMEGGENLPESCFALRSPQRSATSPSLKSLTDTIGTCSLTNSPRADDTSVHSLVRSSSFTLEGPSKVLLEHIRQQKQQKSHKDSDSSVRSPTPSRRTASKQRSTPSPSAWRDTVESKAKRVQKKVDIKPSSRASSNQRSKPKSTFNNYPSSTAPIWNSPLPPIKVKRSPYDAKAAVGTTKLHGKPTGAHKAHTTVKHQKSLALKKSSSSTTYTINNATSSSSLPNDSTTRMSAISDDAEIMAEIDNRHRQKLLALIAQQQEEQRRLQQAFETQQRMLLDQLNNERYRHLSTDNATTSLCIDGVSILSPNALNSTNANNIYNGTTASAPLFDRTSPTLSVTSSYISPGVSGVIGGFTTTTTTTCELPALTPKNVPSSVQRPLQIMEISSPIYANNGATGDKIAANFDSRQSQQPTQKSKEETTNLDIVQLHAAATTINAYARGFLVRRLFQTEQIQRIVQTIRDTLIFVLNLHMETMENSKEANTAANIKLKARLLQQLASASRTLHLIFFQTSIKERMEIISRDRKRIKTKLLSMSLKRSPRIA